MKKIFTLLFVALGIASVSQAQQGTRDTRDNRDIRQPDIRNNDNGYDNDRNIPYDREDGYNNGSKFSSERRLKMEIGRINQEYDFKIQKVRNSFFMSRWEKQRQVRFLEQKRQQEIQLAIMTAKRGNRNHDRNFPDNRRY